MADEKTKLLENFESWLLRRVAQCVEAGEVSVDLLTELQAAFEASHERPHAEAHDTSIQHIVDLAGAPEAEARSVLEAIQAQPSLMQRREYQSGRDPSGRA